MCRTEWATPCDGTFAKIDRNGIEFEPDLKLGRFHADFFFAREGLPASLAKVFFTV